MNDETIQIIIIVFFLLGIAALGVSMIFASRWARRNNTAIKQEMDSTQFDVTKKALKEGRWPFSSKTFWTSDLSITQAAIGKFVAVLVIILVLLFLIFASYAVIKMIQ